MSVRLRLAAFAAALAVTFTATFAAGNALGPDGEERPPPTTAHSAGEHGPVGGQGGGAVDHAPGHGSEEGDP